MRAFHAFFFSFAWYTCLSLMLALFVFGHSFSLWRKSGVAAVVENLGVLIAKGSSSRLCSTEHKS